MYYTNNRMSYQESVAELVKVSSTIDTKMLEHIRENDIFGKRLAYTISDINNPGKRQSEH